MDAFALCKDGVQGQDGRHTAENDYHAELVIVHSGQNLSSNLVRKYDVEGTYRVPVTAVNMTKAD